MSNLLDEFAWDLLSRRDEENEDVGMSSEPEDEFEVRRLARWE